MKTLKVKLFGVLTEIAASSEVELNVDFLESIGVLELQAELIKKYPAMKLVQLKIAVNNQFVSDGQCHEGDIIAVMPPFSGG
ncbi:MAG: MoaD/ThiS family protein [Bacteroidota bacterium]